MRKITAFLAAALLAASAFGQVVTDSTRTGIGGSGGGSSAVTVGTTTVTGTSTYMLYNNGGVVGASPVVTDSSGNLTLPTGAMLKIPQTASSGLAFNYGNSGVGFWQTYNGQLYLGKNNTSTGFVAFDTDGVWMRSDGVVKFSSSAGDPYGGIDTGVSRSAPGVVAFGTGGAASVAGSAIGKNATFAHFIGRGTTPTVADNGSNVSIPLGSDAAANITVGAGTVTSITLTFAAQMPSAPACIASGTSTSGILVATTTTTAILTRPAAAAFTTSEVLHVVCISF